MFTFAPIHFVESQTYSWKNPGLNPTIIIPLSALPNLGKFVYSTLRVSLEWDSKLLAPIIWCLCQGKENIPQRIGSSAVRAPPVAAKMRFDTKIAVISTG